MSDRKSAWPGPAFAEDPSIPCTPSKAIDALDAGVILAGFTDERLIRSAIQNAGDRSVKRQPRWAHVRDLFAIGKTSAHELCVWGGVDPDEEVCGEVTCGDCGDTGAVNAATITCPFCDEDNWEDCD